MTKFLFVVTTMGLFFGFDACRVNETIKTTGSSSLLWKVYGNNLHDTSFLYGTIHIQDKRVFAYGKEVEKAFEISDQLAVEVRMDEINPATIMSVMMMKDTTLDMLLSPEDYKRLEEGYKSITGATLETAKKLKPFFLSANMVQSLVPRDMPQPLDMFFMNKATEQNKKVIGLESFDEQIAIIDDLSYAAQMEMLLESIDDIDKMKEQFKELVEAYLNMNSEKVVELMNDPSMPDEFMDKLLDERNKLMTDRMIPQFYNASTFVAVGAGHLFGDNGIVAMLRNKGFVVEPVVFEFGK